MSAIAFNPGQVYTIDSNKVKASVSSQGSEGKAVTLTQDQVNISVKKGVLPTFKGIGAGALAGAVGGGAAATAVLLPALMSGGEGPAWAMLGVVVAAGAGAIPGAVAGGVTANLTDSKLK